MECLQVEGTKYVRSGSKVEIKGEEETQIEIRRMTHSLGLRLERNGRGAKRVGSEDKDLFVVPSRCAER